MPTHPRLILRLVALTVISLVALPHAGAQPPMPLSVPVHHDKPLGQTPTSSSSGFWTELHFPPSEQLYFGATNPILLTDGTVLVQDTFTGDWASLTPDEKGSYINGIWSGVNPVPAPYGPFIHSSAVLPDGRVIVEGGEYNNFTPGQPNSPVQTNMGAIYDPATGLWTPVAPPPGWGTVGDGPAVVLADGTYMQGNCCNNKVALLDAKTLTWTTTGSSQSAQNQKEGWTLLPGGDVLTVDSYVADYKRQGMNSELYNPHTGSWDSAGSTVVQLWDSQAACGVTDPSSETGPGILQPDGKVFYAGANTCPGVSGNTAIYDTRTGKWTPGPTFPKGLDIATGPAAVEPNGKVLMMASPGIYAAPASFFEWDGASLTPASAPIYASEDTSFAGIMLVLPTGQILLTDFSEVVEVYTPQPGYRREWIPEISRIHGAANYRFIWDLLSGKTYKISGRRFNGMTQGASYGGGAEQSATNYPLVRITNDSTGHVFYCRTHDHSSMAVASESEVSTFFDVPSAIETGPAKLEVVTNGIPSRPEKVEIY